MENGTTRENFLQGHGTYPPNHSRAQGSRDYAHRQGAGYTNYWELQLEHNGRPTGQPLLTVKCSAGVYTPEHPPIDQH